MRNSLTLLAATLILSATTSCKQKPENGIEQKKDNKLQNELPVEPKENAVNSTVEKIADASLQNQAATTRGNPIENTTTIWQRIEVYVNTSTKKDGPVPSEVMATMGKEWHYTVTQLWFMVQFNIKKKLSKGVKGLTEANFDDKYDEQYDIAIRGGY